MGNLMNDRILFVPFGHNTLSAICKFLMLIVFSLFYSEICLASSASAGDFFRVEGTVKNLTDKDGDIVSLEPVFSPKTYRLIFDANGGLFSDGSEAIETDAVYNDGRKILELSDEGTYGLKDNLSFIELPDPPERKGYTFIAWYLKGNGMPAEPSEKDGVIISDGSRYMIANDDMSSLNGTDHTEDGKVIARALWRDEDTFTGDGNDADGSMDTGKISDIWDIDHFNNHVIEYLNGVEDRSAYEKIYGDITDQYRRIILNAEVPYARSYTWYRKAAGTGDYVKLDESEAKLGIDRITRSADGDSYRCEVLMGDNGEKLVFETKIDVYWLPELGKQQAVLEKL